MPSPKKGPRTTSKYVVHTQENGLQFLEGGQQDERIVARRADMLHTRQVELDSLMARHDDLVREAFHLDKFVTLLGYDPKVAKQDTSQVFLEYKASHDLISKSAAATASASGQTPRKTRRATTELRVSLAATISAGTSTPPSTPSSSALKEKTRVVPRPELASPGAKMVTKPKSPAKIVTIADKPSSVSKGKGKAKESVNSQVSEPATDVIFPPPPVPKRGLHPRRAKDGMLSSTPDTLIPGVPSTSSIPRTLKRKNFSSSSLDDNQRDSRQSVVSDIRGENLFPEPEPPPPKLSKPTIKRVRLFQRPPPAVYTHPAQCPSRPHYGGSAQGFLRSYLSLEDGVDLASEKLDHMSLTEAKTRARIQELRKEGRLMLDIPELPDGSTGISSLAVPEGDQVESIRDEDHYDNLVSAAIHRGGSITTEYAIKKSVAKKIAKSVVAWHGNKEGSEEKQRKAEAVRMKALAKFTAKEIEKQWKKAVMAVREQNRALLEAEEARLGRKHLDAILDQSGVILEAQHTDLSRARSRSSSAKDWSDTDGSEDDDIDAVEQGDDQNLDEESGVSDDDMELDADASLLLGTDGRSSVGSRGLSSEAETDSVGHEDEAVLSTIPSPHDTSSDASLGTPLLAEDDGLLLSTTSSEVAMDEYSKTGGKTIPTVSSVPNASMAPAFEQDDSLQEQDSEPCRSAISSVAGSPRSTISVLEDVDVVTSQSALPSKGYREAVYEHGDSVFSTQLSPPLAPRHSDYTPHLHPASTEPPLRPPSPPILSEPSSSSAPTPTGMSPIDSQGDGAVQPNGHQSVAIRLSNGVVIYRNTEVPSALEETNDIEPNGETFQAPNGHQGVPVNVGGSEKPHMTTSEVTLPIKAILPERVRDAIGTDPKNSDICTTDASASLGVEQVSVSLLAETRVITPPPDLQAESEAPSASAPPDRDKEEEEEEEKLQVAPHLVDFAATPVDWDPTSKVGTPFLLRGNLRPYQQSGLEWLASLHTNSLNGILADEMGLGKTIQTISLLAHLACDLGIWGPHLIVVPTSVLLNWEMEFKKFLPGFKILPYHGSTKRRKELRIGWNNKHTFNVCVTSYTLASRDAHIFKRKAWYYMILDEAHMIKNFKSQRWNLLLMFRSFRRLLLTGTPLQNNLTELWALLQFLMSGTNFANLKEFGDWFSNPLEKAIEQGTVMDEETQERVRKLHTVLRPYLLRRLKADVEKELPSKYEHLVICRLSKRQRFLYDEFMSRAQTRDALASGVYHKVANILMQLRKVCNHPDLFEVRPIVTSFAMPRSATADFEIKEFLVRRRLFQDRDDSLNLDLLGLVFIHHQGKSMMQARSTRSLDASSCLPFVTELPGEPPPVDTRTIEGFKRHMAYQRQLATLRQWTHIAYTNRLRCAASPVYGSETVSVIRRLYTPLVPLSEVDFRRPDHLDRSNVLPTIIKSYVQREEDLDGFINRFAFITPPVVSRDMPSIALSGVESQILDAQRLVPELDTILHRTSVKLQIAFPDASLVQYDCGKLQELASLLRIREAGGHRVLIFTQMTKVLDILEIFLNFHGYRYLRLDGATKIEDRQYITERFNNDARVFAFIASSRSGGVGINLTGADTVIFYDSDFNPQMDRQCEDRAHRIGQIRDVHIYRFISEHTVEESMLRKANQKRSLDNIVIQQGEFDWRSLLIDDEAFGKALGEFEDKEDAYAARVAAREEAVKEVEDRADFAAEGEDIVTTEVLAADLSVTAAPEVEETEEEGTIADYMLAFVNRDWEWFSTWRL